MSGRKEYVRTNDRSKVFADQIDYLDRLIDIPYHKTRARPTALSAFAESDRGRASLAFGGHAAFLEANAPIA
jgi:hypothetical protein